MDNYCLMGSQSQFEMTKKIFEVDGGDGYTTL